MLILSVCLHSLVVSKLDIVSLDLFVVIPTHLCLGSLDQLIQVSHEHLHALYGFTEVISRLVILCILVLYVGNIVVAYPECLLVFGLLEYA